MSLVEDFVQRYTREYDFYREVARVCEQICETGLERAGIRAIVTSRAKRPDRLKTKLEKRNEEKNYRHVSDIYDDLVDLAGVRIALYFPGDLLEVRDFIKNNFVTLGSKEFPIESRKPTRSKRFSGYWAEHFRVSLREDTLNDTQKRFSLAKVEIQVASVLMHAWAEVEHDLAYKPLNGELSDTEHAILDELNGIVLAGEIALERLQQAIKERADERGRKFGNHFELATWLYHHLGQSKPSVLMGRADILLRFLELAELDYPERLAPYTIELDADSDNLSLVEQIVDRILETDQRYYDAYSRAKSEIGDRNPYRLAEENGLSADQAYITFFISRWNLFELVSRLIVVDESFTEKTKYLSRGSLTFLASILLEKGQISPSDVEHLREARNIRNGIVHGVQRIERASLLGSGQALEAIVTQISRFVSADNKQEIDRVLRSLPPAPRASRSTRHLDQHPVTETASSKTPPEK